MLPINLDAGEYETEPESLFLYADVVNIACGGHAGGPALIEKTLAACKNCQISAHPSYPDRLHFGRNPMNLSPEALRQSLQGQLSLLYRHTTRNHLQITHLKAHGALYHAASADPAIAGLLLEVAGDILPHLHTLIGPPQSELQKQCPPHLCFWREGFADRGYTLAQSLIPRGLPGAILPVDEAYQQAVLFSKSGLFDTLCVHGDTPDAEALLRRLKNS